MKKLAIILFLLSFLELLIFGARGAMFSVVIFCVLYLFFVSKLKMKVIFSFLIFVIYFGLKYVLTFIIKFLAKYKIESYAITKYLNVLNGNSFSSTTSGRDIIYETALSRMNESFLFGSPFNTCYIDTGSTYYHNILLDILVNFGVFVLVFFLLFMFLQFYRIGKTKNKELKLVFSVLFSISIGRLILSSSLWQRPEFWLFMGFPKFYNIKNFS